MKKEEFVARCPKLFHPFARTLADRNSYYMVQFAVEWAGNLADKRVLEAGCGAKSTLNRCQPPLRHLVGLDPLHDSLRENPDVDWKVQGVLENLPFHPESFDAIYSDSVFEHLEDPAKACREFYRVLRPGGKVLINTNSIFNPFMFPNKFLSLSMRDRLKDVLRIESAGTFHAPYRANTKARLKRHLRPAGFHHLRFYRWGLPGMMQPKWFLALELGMELLSEIPIFGGLKHRLMVTAEK
jgi:ubiquinone/menaquinone biosynthesis C-methylase UbiE